MKYRYLASAGTLAFVAAALVALETVQPASAQVATRQTTGARGKWTPPRTPWGEPDLQGTWTNSTTTPLERPDALAGKASLTDQERTDLDTQAARNADRPPRAGDTGAYNDFWFDRGKRTSQTSLIIDPPDGKLPALTPKGRQLQDSIAAVRKGSPTAPEDLSLFERCITRSLPGAMMPGFYNHNYQIVQSPGYVMLLIEMIHDVRIIPTDGRPHVGPAIRQWLGDSRGRWDGNTLVVETKNVVAAQELRPSRTVMGGSDKLTIVERFTRVDADTIDYQFTVTDPEMFTRPWTAKTPMSKTDSQIFEYACHEGNYAIVNMLKGARLAEQEAGGAPKR
jgi:hypothetical protein